MTKNPRPRNAFRELRQKAEHILRESGTRPVQVDRDDLLHLVHELEVHQVELELQNDELRRAQAELEASRDQFADLYDSAPVAYVTLNAKGTIERANRAAHALIGGGRTLEGSLFSSLILEQDLFIYYDYFNRAASHEQAPEPVELRVSSDHGQQPVHVQLEASLNSPADEGGIRWRLALVDITRSKQAERNLERQAASLEEQVRDRTRELEKANEALEKELKRRNRYEKALEASESKARSEAAGRRYLAGRLVELLEEDRRHLALMLHDDLGQTLTGAKMALESIRAELRQKADVLAGRMDHVVESLQGVIAALRDTSRELRPSSLDMLGLVPGLRSLAEGAQNKTRRIHYFFKHVPDTLDPDLQLAMYRIAQEAVQNAVQHSGCTEIHVSLTLRDSVLHLTVEDNGCGFVRGEAVSEVSGRGPLGLMIMRERAVHAGGELFVDSVPEKGTTVKADVPVESASSFEETSVIRGKGNRP